MTEKKLYNVLRRHMVTRLAEVLADNEDEAEQIARKNSDNLHWKETKGCHWYSVEERE